MTYFTNSPYEKTMQAKPHGMKFHDGCRGHTFTKPIKMKEVKKNNNDRITIGDLVKIPVILEEGK